MSGPVEGRLAALPDGPFTAPRRHQWRGSLPLLRLRENSTAAAVDVLLFVAAFTSFDFFIYFGGRTTQPPADFPAGPERRRHLQRIDVANWRISHSQTHQRYAQRQRSSPQTVFIEMEMNSGADLMEKVKEDVR